MMTLMPRERHNDKNNGGEDNKNDNHQGETTGRGAGAVNGTRTELVETQHMKVP